MTTPIGSGKEKKDLPSGARANEGNRALKAAAVAYQV